MNFMREGLRAMDWNLITFCLFAPIGAYIIIDGRYHDFQHPFLMMSSLIVAANGILLLRRAQAGWMRLGIAGAWFIGLLVLLNDLFRNNAGKPETDFSFFHLVHWMMLVNLCLLIVLLIRIGIRLYDPAERDAAG